MEHRNLNPKPRLSLQAQEKADVLKKLRDNLKALEEMLDHSLESGVIPVTGKETPPGEITRLQVKEEEE